MGSIPSKPKEKDAVVKTSDETFELEGASEETFDNICDVCVQEKHVEAKAYCADCRQYLCHGCHRTHGRLKATKDHKILTGDELMQVHGKESPSFEHTSRRSARPQLADNELRSSGETLNKTHTKSDPSFQPSKRKECKAKDVENVEDFDTGSVEVCGIEVAMNGYLLICDHGKRTVSLFDTQFKELSKIRLSSAPWSIALLSPMNWSQNLSVNDHKTSNDVLLSFPDTFRLQHAKIENTKTLTLGKFFHTSVGFLRIIRYKDGLIALSEDDQSYTFSIVDRHGNIKQTIRREMKGSGLFKTAYFMALSKDNNVLYVTDFYNGCFGFTMAGDVVFTYRGEGINDYVGVATDTDGFVYISGPDTNTIVKVNSDGKKVKNLVKTDGMKPGLMIYDPLQNKLIAKEFFGSRIFVFTLGLY